MAGRGEERRVGVSSAQGCTPRLVTAAARQKPAVEVLGVAKSPAATGGLRAASSSFFCRGRRDAWMAASPPL